MPDLLVDAEDLRLYLQLDAGDKPSDEWLEAAAAGVSAEIMDETGRRYLPASAQPETRTFDHDGDRSIDIDDCRDVTLVRVSADPQDPEAWQELTSADWVAEPAGDTIRYRLRFLSPVDELPASNRGFGYGFGPRASSTYSPWPREAARAAGVYMTVEVTAKWGHAAIPENVKLAALVWVQHLHKRDVAFFNRDFGEDAPEIGKMPPEIARIIKGQRRTRTRVGAV